jgi:hypothetical protein
VWEFEEEYQWDYEDHIPVTYLDVAEMDVFERIAEYYDTYPLLEERKALWRFTQLISYNCFRVVKSWQFETIVMIVIITNSIALALDDPTAKSSNTALTELDFVFLLLYTTEMGFKILAYGFLLNKGSYLRDMWNILDFVIVFTA